MQIFTPMRPILIVIMLLVFAYHASYAATDSPESEAESLDRNISYAMGMAYGVAAATGYASGVPFTPDQVASLFDTLAGSNLMRCRVTSCRAKFGREWSQGAGCYGQNSSGVTR